jgi:NADH:ubiquinone oxidoreductase subunit 2 (subunit N)
LNTLPLFKYILVFIIIGSIVVGSVLALFETKLRRLIAFSSTNQIGFVFVGALYLICELEVTDA